MISTANFLALALQCAPTIHPDTTTDIGYTESRFQHMAIGVVGGKSIYPKNINDALEHINKLKAKGKNYSIGLMQINQANFKKYGVTAEDMFNPCKNLSIYEKIITDCYTRGETLKRALSCYYSGNFDTGQSPESAFGNTSYVQRVGYAVPSTKQDKAQPEEPVKPGENTIYPDTVLRAAAAPVKSTSTITYPAQIVRGSFVISKESKNEISEPEK
ncbi:lytic transglycosylase domain-containing protein [Salmonella enterica]|nr:TriA protein [Salmonella enterica subsp. enterica serovar Glostrup]ECG9331094.1 lytic transglycosylase domain-containing protein [Salmonella enterica]EEE8158196.1 lytic transglycosylase domain-containing protein [Salmonella enterica subsp. enterica serovar Badagry]EIN7308247.1 lytic transglycosylase domain-containing protein [Salmonella enterica subsp. enterica serovar Telelkebir]